MFKNTRSPVLIASLLCAWLGNPVSSFADATPEQSKNRVVGALQNSMNLERPDQDGFATIWDGNKYVQCGRRSKSSPRRDTAEESSGRTERARH
ncbi:MAG TPA: hypothetical protein VF778_04740 [Xanthobacteraceae bacterium]